MRITVGVAASEPTTSLSRTSGWTAIAVQHAGRGVFDGLRWSVDRKSVV